MFEVRPGVDPLALLVDVSRETLRLRIRALVSFAIAASRERRVVAAASG